MQRAREPGSDLDSTRWRNILALDSAYAEGKAALPAGPLEAYIEVSARCNLRCGMCAITVDPRYDPHSGNPPLLTDELFALLEPLLPTLQRVYLNGLGEPFLNRRLLGFAQHLAAAGIEVWITTNATLVTEEQAEALALAGVERVTVSIDASTAATYEQIRVRGNFEHAVRGIRALGAARRRHGRPKLFLSLIAMRSNLAELKTLVELCAEAGGDGVFVESLYTFPALEEFSRQEDLSLLGADQIRELLAAARRRAGELGVQLVTRLDEFAFLEDAAAAAASSLADPPQRVASLLSGRSHDPAAPIAAAGTGEPVPHAVDAAVPMVLPWACSEPWATINVSASGDVRTCCFNNEVFGNLAQQPFGAIWNGETYQNLRSEHIAGRVPESCATCVRHGRVKRSAFLAPRRARQGEEERARPPATRASLLFPVEGELLTSPLVVVGRLPPVGARQSTPDLPDLHIDGALLVRLRDFAVVDGDRFAAVLAIPWVSTGAHVLALASASLAADAADARFAANPENAEWDRRRLQMGRLGGEAADLALYRPDQIPPAPATLTAVARFAFALPLSRREDSPSLRVGNHRHSLFTWLCAPHAVGWMGVAVVDVRKLLPGSYEIELRLRDDPPFRRRLERLSDSPLSD